MTYPGRFFGLTEIPVNRTVGSQIIIFDGWQQELSFCIIIRGKQQSYLQGLEANTAHGTLNSLATSF